MQSGCSLCLAQAAESKSIDRTRQSAGGMLEAARSAQSICTPGLQSGNMLSRHMCNTQMKGSKLRPHSRYLLNAICTSMSSVMQLLLHITHQQLLCRTWWPPVYGHFCCAWQARLQIQVGHTAASVGQLMQYVVLIYCTAHVLLLRLAVDGQDFWQEQAACKSTPSTAQVDHS